MSHSRNKLYTILFTACTVGYIWLYYAISTNKTGIDSVLVCLFKHVTDIPCPSCGSTRSVLAMLHGDFMKSLFINPFGFVIAFIMLATPLWMIIDLSNKRKTLFDFYHKIELKLKKPLYAIPLIFLVMMNWIWNITKGL